MRGRWLCRLPFMSAQPVIPEHCSPVGVIVPHVGLLKNYLNPHRIFGAQRSGACYGRRSADEKDFILPFCRNKQNCVIVLPHKDSTSTW
ncbi:hypothetical protein GDO81_004061 [Engystomops pustulosus]|uniref:Uncharacterized protein n=1 Tax=Engystomops pustulosus TaxID=76066 RepID=A0AAV6ZXE9_ENGPU|nr:hypothetical protein GDO81_004061 [Engystomops pustulosus]